VTSRISVLDSLTYTYAANDGNRLTKVADAGLATSGFIDGQTSGNQDYKYDTLRNLKVDINKGIDSLVYNVLGKVSKIYFHDGRTTTYLYDATGTKLRVKNHPVSGSNDSTDYVGGFVYQNYGLSFFRSPEGRVVKNGSNLEFQYALTDHQGNTRVLFTSATPSPTSVTANMEGGTNTDFSNYTNRVNFELFDHTDFSGSTYTYSQKLTGASGQQVGVAKSFKVYPGDKIKIKAYAKYQGPPYSARVRQLR
jgi:hypothetical protein